ncbi:hypothetical protein VQL36_13410 [Chengkuizengella sp. SCS-71B]
MNQVLALQQLEAKKKSEMNLMCSCSGVDTATNLVNIRPNVERK